MKTKLAIAVTLISGSMGLLFAAAKVDTCAEKFKTCSQACDNTLQKGKLAGRSDETTEREHKTCMKKCETEKADCEKNAGSVKK